MPSPRFTLLTAAAFMLLLAPLLAVAPHPTVLLAEYGKDFRPIVNVIGTDPVISIEKGKETRIRREVAFTADRAPYYADGFIRFSSISIDGLRLSVVFNTAGTGGGVLNDVSYFDATVVSDRPLTHCFIAVLCFDGAFTNGDVDRPQAEIVVHDLPDLVADKETRIRFSAADFRRRTGAVFFPLIFTAGMEVRTNLTDIADRYFARVEEIQHTARLAAYREKFAGQNHAAIPVVMIRPTLPTGVEMPRNEDHIVRLFVAEDGTVNDADITPEFSSSVVQTEVRRAFLGWRFLPKLVNGEPAVAQIKFPLK